MAGLFLAMAGVAFALAAGGDRTKRREGIAIAAAAFIPPVFLAWAFPEGGWAPFPFTAYLPIPLFAIACLLVLPRREKALRWGAALYGAARRAALFLDTQMGGNAVRLGALVRRAGARCARSGAAPGRGAPGRCRCSACGFAALAFWQWSPAVRDVIKYIEDPAAKSDYFEPLRQYLATLPDQRRIEIPFTRSHWEGAEIALRHAARPRLAAPARHRAQPDLLPAVPINPLTYASWLAENAVRYVALPSAKPDKSSYARARADRARPALPAAALALRRLARVRGDPAHALRDPAEGREHRARGAWLGQVLLDVKRPGEAIVRVRWTQYWFAAGRVRGALRELDPDHRAEEGPRANEHPLLARAASSRRGRRCDGSAS